MTSAVMIIADAYRAAGNAFGEAMGWGPGVYSVPLSPTGDEPATHWGLRADAGDALLAVLADPPPEAAALAPHVTYDLRETDDPFGHWQDVLAGLGLAVVQADAP
jgi:hypothetical protein